MGLTDTIKAKLENWSVGPSRDYDAYTPPECVKLSLSGNVYGHPRFNDGDFVTTSSIKEASGRFITTNSGTVYELGIISPNYEKWLGDTNYPYDPDNPIKIKD